MQFVKLWWMGYWRLWLLFAFVGESKIQLSLTLSLIAAFVVRFVFGYTIATWPLVRLAFRRDVLEQLRFKRGSRPTSLERAAPRPRTSTADNAYAPGSITGYEPRSLDNVQIGYNTLMHGDPGYGLSNSGFSQENIELGQKGEVNFAKTLTVATHSSGFPLISATETFWSVAMPSAHSARVVDPHFKTDIDCIVVSADTIFLIDIKFYKSGNVAYSTKGDQLLCRDLTTNSFVGSPKEMSRNMAMAHDRFSTHFPNMKVVSRVVFMPTDKGTSRVTGVYWPGDIPAIGIMGMLDELSRVKSSRSTTYGRSAAATIDGLLK